MVNFFQTTVYQHYKWLVCTASLTISTLQTARIHGQYYDINITSDWDAQLVLSYKYYKWLRCTASITIYINITSGWNTEPVLPYKY